MLWDNDQRKFVDGGCTTTRLDDPCLQGLSITPQEVIERIHKAKGPGGRLDLTGVGLREVPSEVWTLTDLADLQLSNNKLTCLPEGLGNLKHLERLGLAGNRLRSLPESIGNCVKLEGLWAHGNVLGSLPSAIGKCEWLRHLMLAGNRLRALPDGIGDLDALEELSAPGNRLRAIPETIVGCASLRTLDLHGNEIETLPDAMGSRCRSLEEVSVQGNRLTSVPDSFCDARRLKRLNVAENALESLPEKLGDAAMLTQLWVYANPKLSRLPTSLAANVSLKQIWAEGCALDGNDGNDGNALKAYVSFAAEGGGGKRKTPPALLGLDADQLARAGMEENKVAPFVRVANVGVVSSWLAGGAQDTPRGYFKLEKWVPPKEVLFSHSGSEGSGTERRKEGRKEKAPVLIVAFGSAPGVPNWGGLLKKLRDDVRARGVNNVRGAGAGAAAAVTAARLGFDVLYVADTARSWYGGAGFGDGDAGETAERRWRGAVREISDEYERVVHLGDSMGASAALLFADLADVSLAFCPQVDLVSASIRPGRSAPWMRRYEGAMIAAVRRAVDRGSRVVVHTGSWAHDVDQASAVLRGLGSVASGATSFADANTGGSVTVVTHHVDNHRLALALEEGGELLPIVRLALHEQIAAATREGGDDASSSSAAKSKETGGVDDIALKKFNPAVRGI